MVSDVEVGDGPGDYRGHRVEDVVVVTDGVHDPLEDVAEAVRGVPDGDESQDLRIFSSFHLRF
jgi:hypothetical protein